MRWKILTASLIFGLGLCFLMSPSDSEDKSRIHLDTEHPVVVDLPTTTTLPIVPTSVGGTILSIAPTTMPLTQPVVKHHQKHSVQAPTTTSTTTVVEPTTTTSTTMPLCPLLTLDSDGNPSAEFSQAEFETGYPCQSQDDPVEQQWFSDKANEWSSSDG